MDNHKKTSLVPYLYTFLEPLPPWLCKTSYYHFTGLVGDGGGVGVVRASHSSNFYAPDKAHYFSKKNNWYFSNEYPQHTFSWRNKKSIM